MDLSNLINSGAQFKVEVNGYDLAKFADDLIRKAMEEQRLIDASRQAQEAKKEPGGETYLTSQEAAKMCNVCITTLWAWAKAGYLIPCKVGRSNRYALSDIQMLLANHGVHEDKAKMGIQPRNKAQQEIERQRAMAGL